MCATEDLVRLRHMLDATRKAIEFTQSCRRDDFIRDEKLLLAVVRLLEVLGEAAKNVSAPCRKKFPKIPWRQITGTRDRLIHGYFDVDLDILWNIVTVDLPPLLEQLKKILS